jgi:transposase
MLCRLFGGLSRVLTQTELGSIFTLAQSNAASKRLDAIPGVGPALATALVATVADPSAFRSGRNFSAWIGLVPKRGQGQARWHQQAG